MADSKPTPSEPEAASNLAKSFEDRLTFPDDKQGSKSPNPQAASFTPSKFDWADEVTTPVQETPKKPDTTSDTPSKSQANGAGDAPSDMAAQTDGATTWMGGSSGLDEPEFDVNVKLADLQADPNNPLYSVKSFEQLNL